MHATDGYQLRGRIYTPRRKCITRLISFELAAETTEGRLFASVVAVIQLGYHVVPNCQASTSRRKVILESFGKLRKNANCLNGSGVGSIPKVWPTNGDKPAAHEKILVIEDLLENERY